jgi:hypothetical protein
MARSPILLTGAPAEPEKWRAGDRFWREAAVHTQTAKPRRSKELKLDADEGRQSWTPIFRPKEPVLQAE